ncbi:MAG: glycosyltransferase family 4 protein [Clostridia bacterium]|nr:glycosyltransferase family 4 protein [Clostridia bacterium]
MKILHCCLSGIYVEGYGYQENHLTELQKAAGHDVRVAASTEVLSDGKTCFVSPGVEYTASGIEITRLAYAPWMPGPLKSKLRVFPKFRELLEGFAPDIVYFHGAASYELCTAARYRREHPETSLFVDSHAASYNSATNFVSKYLQHKGLYRLWYNRAKKYIDRLYYIGYYEKLYLEEHLHADESSMEALDLGGLVLEREERLAIRDEVRRELCIADDSIVFLHSGKLDPRKRTRELLEAFSAVRDERFVLLIIGFVPDDLRPVLDDAIAADGRIRYLGWMDAEGLKRHICASDMYLQPGSTSASLQLSLCCGTPAMIYPHETYTHLFTDDPSIAYAEDTAQMSALLSDISGGKVSLGDMGEAATLFAARRLDYREQAERICREHEKRHAKGAVL